jgi:(p)ppGpp synthase/HD superfamily hydrolase
MAELKDWEKAREFALKAHADVNQMYRDKPYSFHLEQCDMLFERFKHLLPPEDVDDAHGGMWCHDTIEDTGKTFNDVKKATNETIAEYAYRLTNEKGRNRHERANEKYYREIKEYKHAAFDKLIDRIANITFSKINGDSMFKTYQKEHLFMVQHMYTEGKYEELWNALSNLIYS